MKYSQHTYADAFWLKRLAHEKRLQTAFKLINLAKADSLLDFGGGDGIFAEFVIRQGFSAPKITVFEPSDSMYKQLQAKFQSLNGPLLLSQIDQLAGKKFDRISCLEVFEHLGEKEIDKTLSFFSNILAKQGKLIISVPLEIGLSSLAKNIFRSLGSKNEQIPLQVLLKSLLGIKQNREAIKKLDKLDYIYSHVGFDYRDFRGKISDYFMVLNQEGSPFKPLGPLFNYTIYFTCQKKELHGS